MAEQLTYKDSGVDIDAGNYSVKLIKDSVKATYRPEVLGDLGGFGGLFALNSGKYKEPVLVSGTDGVGTKLRLAFMLDKHDTIGQDAVAMCVNDILVQGAEPLFFLDYLAVGKLDPEQVASVVKGVANACKESGCALIGGETAEMSGFYPVGEYDIAGFAVGVVEKSKVITSERVKEGDVLLGLPSSGVHSNGYSLVRKVFNVEHADLGAYVDELGCTLGEELLRPTKIYVKPVLAAMDVADVHGVSHITGGGFYENIPRCIPDGLCAKIDKGAVKVLPIFDLIAKTGNIPERDMFNTYNMGVGMSIVVPAAQVQTALDILTAHGEDAYVIGTIVKNDEEKVILE